MHRGTTKCLSSAMLERFKGCHMIRIGASETLKSHLSLFCTNLHGDRSCCCRSDLVNTS